MCRRYTLGIIIGILNVFAYIVASIAMIAYITNDVLDTRIHEMEESKRNLKFYDSTAVLNEDRLFSNSNTYVTGTRNKEALKTFIFSSLLSAFLLMAIVSGMLIVGIIKRREKLMWSWLALNILGVAANCLAVLLSIIIATAYGSDVGNSVGMFISGVLGVGFQALMTWPIYTLCKDITEKNNQRPVQIEGGVQYSFVAPNAPPQYNEGTSLQKP